MDSENNNTQELNRLFGLLGEQMAKVNAINKEALFGEKDTAEIIKLVKQADEVFAEIEATQASIAAILEKNRPDASESEPKSVSILDVIVQEAKTTADSAMRLYEGACSSDEAQELKKKASDASSRLRAAVDSLIHSKKD